ncbi:MAG: hypothetical protein FJ098_01220 [Deltaproteobacteria bacterium]|nr:hypothetical protein [Deltaproteobacteria bacterium]
MALVTLQTLIAAKKFGGGSRLYGKSAADLSGIVRSIQATVNETVNRINGTTACHALQVGTVTGYYAGGTNHGWLLCDGTNPPFASKYRIQDQNTGSLYDIECQAGALVLVGPL